MSRFIYSLVLYLLLPFTAIKLMWRGIKQPDYLRHWKERYGFFNIPIKAPLIWLHCVSVGETRAAGPLIEQLLKTHPKHAILMTHATPTGRAAGEQLFPAEQYPNVFRCYLPYDVPYAIGRFLKHFQPSIGLLMETELWFNLISACKVKNIPLLLVNARLSERSARRYAKVGGLTAQGLNSLAGIAAQTAQDAARFAQLMRNNPQSMSVMGNLKFDVTPPKGEAERGRYLRGLLGVNRPIFLAASTRDGEEKLILDALENANIPHLLTIMVPRHPQRFDEVAHLLESKGIPYCRRSEFAMGNVASEIPNCQVILGDSMGEMFTYYAACDVALIGGSLLPLGGQNLIEACAMGKPVLMGEHTFNFSEASEQAIAAGAALRVNEKDLAEKLSALIQNPARQNEMGKAGLAFSQNAGGATKRLMQLIDQQLTH
jgi:3-deoxy-D-manno-octulosonic-acid transferase